MRGFFRFIWLCVKIAPKGVREFVDIPATFVGIFGPILAWRHPDYWNTEKGQIQMNALYWMVPCGFAWLYLVVRSLLSPYLVYQESQAEKNRLQATLDDYEETPVFPRFIMPFKPVSRIKVKIISKSDAEEPIESIFLQLSDGDVRSEVFGKILTINGISLTRNVT